jgi:short-subunit dehydrogenase involved in D-alanine esterification of teichoic acids
MAITTNTKVVVLGGTSGIRLATAKASPAAEVRVVIASSNPTKVKSALAQLPMGSEGCTVDALTSEELAAFVEHIGEFRPPRLHDGRQPGSHHPRRL